MTKLVELDILWIDESEIYVADKSLYETADKFLQAVISHIQQLIDDFSYEECGWFIAPEFDKYLPRVCTQWMVHRINSRWHDSPFWELTDEPGKGHREVWYIDFSNRN
jgi:hypothetical protein